MSESLQDSQSEVSADASESLHARIWQNANARALASTGTLNDSINDVGDVDNPFDVPPFPGFVSQQFKYSHPKVSVLPNGCDWTKLNAELVTEMRPARAERILVPIGVVKRDASMVGQWLMPVGPGSARAYACAALTSGMFAGTAMGVPSGRHVEYGADSEEADTASVSASSFGGGKKKRAPQLLEVNRYVFTPSSDSSDQHPMFQIGFEEILNEEETEVTFIGVWKFTYDDMHSSSYLLQCAMVHSAAMLRSQSASSQAPSMRNRNYASEVDRRRKAGLTLSDLNTNFENTVGLQYNRLQNTDIYKKVLEIHGAGKMFVSDVNEHISNPAGRKTLSGDNVHGFGGIHPLSPEFVFNAKRSESLQFGSVNLDGTPGNIHKRYLDASSYWHGDEFSTFKLPCHDSNFWICTSVERRSIFELPLPRPLQDQVLPGPHLMKLFVERTSTESEPTCSDSSMGDDACSESASEEEGRTHFSHEAYSRFRSTAKQVDDSKLKDSKDIRSMLNRYDDMGVNASVVSSAVSSSDTVFSKGDKENSYKIRVQKITDTVTEESNRIFSKIVSPWVSETTKRLQVRRSDYIMRVDADYSSTEWTDIEQDEIEFQRRYYNVKKDLTQYQLRCLEATFHSEQDRRTIPAGYKSMFNGLQKQLEINGGSASMAFPPNRKGKQITASDRSVWHELQEWLGTIFTSDAMIEGRDRFILDELYLQAFTVYSTSKFVLIICSERGKGKSVRASRLSKLLSEGVTSWQAASSSRSGMNGNHSSSNGCMIIFDEMTSDLTPAECGERIEYWKQILTNSEYTLERTCHTSNASGTDSYITCEIVTDHSECYTICTNLGQCFTTGDREPSSGKFAMINRSIALFARTETKHASSDDEFERRLESPQVKQRINDFRLFSNLVGFCKLAMKNCQWLQPDLSFANLIWQQGDRMIQDEYSLPLPEPRRMTRRAENCRTQAIMESVARTYMFKQTAVHSDSGCPMRDSDGTIALPVRAKNFEIGDLWDCIRLASTPSRDVIRDSWTKSLYYSISTSPNGVNVMTSLCHHANISLHTLFKKPPEGTTSNILKENGVDAQALQSYLSGGGADMEELRTLRLEMTEGRRLRHEWRRFASTSDDYDTTAFNTIKRVLQANSKTDELKPYVNALMPTYRDACLHYKPEHVLKWAAGLQVSTSEDPLPGSLSYRSLISKDGSSKTYDHAWLLLKPNEGSSETRYHGLAGELKSGAHGTTPVTMFDMHYAGVLDTLLMLETPEANRACPEMPKTTDVASVFIDERENIPNKESKHVKLRQVTSCIDVDKLRLRDGAHPSSNVRIHDDLDPLINKGRFPALRPYTSSKITNCSPLRRMRDSGIELNTVVAYEHVSMIMESSIRCADVDGLKNHQERFCSSDGFTYSPLAVKSHGCKDFAQMVEGKSSSKPEGKVETLPFSVDLMQIAWSIDLSERLYCDTLKEDLSNFNQMIKDHELGEIVNLDEMPQQHLACMGYQIPIGKRREIMQLLGLPLKQERSVTPIEISEANPISQWSEQDLYNEAATALGYKPDAADLMEFKANLMGSGFTHNVTGDVNAYSTWKCHALQSSTSNGNALVDEEEDPMLRSLLDAETMFECRVVERMGLIKDSEESLLQIDIPWPQSYTAEIRRARSEKKACMEALKRRPAETIGRFKKRMKLPQASKPPSSPKENPPSSSDSHLVSFVQLSDVRDEPESSARRFLD